MNFAQNLSNMGAIGKAIGWELEQFRDGSRPFKHQILDAQQMMRDGRVILASEMGTGKTRSVLLACRQIQRAALWPTIVCCPAGLTINWQREARLTGMQVSTFSWAKVPPIDFIPEGFPFILVGDEIQAIQNMASKRTKAFLALAALAQAVFVISGTPTKNGRPRELYAILKALGHPVAEKSQEFDKRFCGGYLRKIKKKPCKKFPKGRTIRFWDNRGATNVEELHKILAPITIRRLKKDCLDLPPKTRKMVDLEATEEEQVSYKRELDFAMFEAQAAADEGGDPGTLAIRALNYTRQACSAYKIPHVVEMAAKLIAEGHAVLLFSYYIDTANTIGKQLGCRVYTGDTNKADRQEIVDEFQSGKSKVISFSYAGGVGLTLTKASYIILVDRPWTMADAEQAEDRAHRAGQFNPVTAIWPRMFSIDAEVDRCLLSKGEMQSRLVDGKGLGTKGNLAVTVLSKLWQKHFGENS